MWRIYAKIVSRSFRCPRGPVDPGHLTRLQASGTAPLVQESEDIAQQARMFRPADAPGNPGSARHPTTAAPRPRQGPAAAFVICGQRFQLAQSPPRHPAAAGIVGLSSREADQARQAAQTQPRVCSQCSFFTALKLWLGFDRPPPRPRRSLRPHPPGDAEGAVSFMWRPAAVPRLRQLMGQGGRCAGRRTFTEAGKGTWSMSRLSPIGRWRRWRRG